MLQAWALQRNTFSASFREFMDGLVRGICSQQACPQGGRPEDCTDLLDKVWQELLSLSQDTIEAANG